MKEVLTYFKAERAESLVFIGTGVAAVLVALWLLLSVKKPFYNGTATSLILIATIQLVVGSIVFARSPSDIKRVEAYIVNDRSKIKSVELPRMEKVMHGFVTYRYIEITLAILGFALIFYFNESPYWKGFGAGLLAQAFLMLLFDYFAESRGEIYLNFLRRFDDSTSISR